MMGHAVVLFAIGSYTASCLRTPDHPLSEGIEYKQIYTMLNQIKSDGLAPSQEMLSLRADILRHATQAGAADPCGATILATIGPSQPKGIGFGARMNNFAMEILLAAYLNVSLAACGSQFGDHFASQMWLSHYSNVLSVPICNESDRCNFNTWNNPRQPYMLGRLLMSQFKATQVSDLLHFVYPYILNLNSHTQERVEATIRELGLYGADYVGVHVRQGDKKYEPGGVQRLSSYVHAVRDIDLPRHPHVDSSSNEAKVGSSINRTSDMLGVAPGTKVFISSDDPQAFPKIAAALGTKYKLCSVKERGNTGTHMRPFESRPDYQDDDTSLALVTDIEILRRATVFLGTANSNMGRLVHVLRGPHMTSINLGRSKEVESDWIEDFQKYPLTR